MQGLALTLIRAILLLAFLSALGTICYQQWFGPPAVNHENRQLAAQPNLPLDVQQIPDFPGVFAAYMNDNFGFRSELLRLYHRLLIRMNSSPTDKVILGKEGWLFYTNQQLTDQNRGAMPLDDQSLSRYLKGFRNQREWLEERAIEHLLLPTPDKNTLFPEFLPDWINRVRPSRYQQVLQYLSDNGEPYVNILPALRRAKSRNERIYLQTDTHWSCLGGFRAYQVLMDHVETLNLPGVRRLTEADVEFTELQPTPGGDMSRNMLLLDDIVLEGKDVDCRIRGERSVVATRVRDGFVAKKPLVPRQQQQRWRYRRGNEEIQTRVLLYRDSYSHVLIPYLAVTFDELVVVPRPRMIFKQEEVYKFDPDLVVYQFVERALLWEPGVIANSE